MQNMVVNEGVDGTDSRRVSWVVGPRGERLTINDMPPVGCRWRIIQKAAVVAAVEGGLMSVEEILARYNLTFEELAGWQRAAKLFGPKGLSATRAVEYRDKVTKKLEWVSRPHV